MIFYPALAFIGFFHIYFYCFYDGPALSFSSVTGGEVLILYGLVFFSTLFHELGHSSACHFFGAKHGDIGVGLYLYIPVFYADVSDIWKLRRTERAVVDFGGMYFQLLMIPILYLLYVFLGNHVFLYTIYALNFSIIASLNPLFRFDGYWLASDLAGVSNLRKRSQETLRYMIRKLLKQTPSQEPYILQIRPAAKYFLFLYTIVSNLFFAIFIYHIVANLPQLLQEYPAKLMQFFSNLQKNINSMSLSNALRDISSIFFPSLILLMLAMMLFRLSIRIYRYFSH